MDVVLLDIGLKDFDEIFWSKSLRLNIQEDHIHMVVSVPPKYSISSLMGLKGKLALKLFQQYETIGKRYWGRHLWARGYCVSTVVSTKTRYGSR